MHKKQTSAGVLKRLDETKQETLFVDRKKWGNNIFCEFVIIYKWF